VVISWHSNRRRDPSWLNSNAIAVDPTRGYVYVANRGDDTISVITETSVITTVPVSAGPLCDRYRTGYRIRVLAHDLNRTVEVISGTQVIATLSSELGTHAVAVNPATQLVYMANEYSSSVSVIGRLPFKTYLPVALK